LTDDRTGEPPFILRRFSSAEDLVEAAVQSFLEVVVDRSPARLALATGRTYVPFYGRLARVADAGERTALGLARGFNLDELVLPPGHPRSFASYMERHAFGPTALERKRFLIPQVPASGSGGVSGAELETICRGYERSIQRFLPVDLALLGLGVDGHVAHNLPGVPPAVISDATEPNRQSVNSLPIVHVPLGPGRRCASGGSSVVTLSK